MEISYYDFEKVRNAVHTRIDELVQELLPSARRSGSSWRVGSLGGEPGGSLSISTKSNNAGSYVDHADKTICGDAIALVANCKNLEYKDAGNWLGEWLGVTPDRRLIQTRRAEPKIEEVRQNHTITAVTHKAINFAAQRKIPEEIIRSYGIEATDQYIVFPHYDDEGQVVHLKFWSLDGQKRIFSNKDPILTLFGKPQVNPMKTGSKIIITEGHWDALAWASLGYPAVSIPSGAEADDWMKEDFTYLNQFAEIYLDFDKDNAGRELESRAKVRLGYERCRVIRYDRFKDANEALMSNEAEILIQAFNEARDAPVERIARADSMRETVRNSLNKTIEMRGNPCFMKGLPIEFRPYEMTLWFGWTSHGKSAIVSQQVAYDAGKRIPSMVASFEQKTDITVGAMMLQFSSDPQIGVKSDFDEAYDALMSNVIFYDSVARCNPDELIATMTQAHKQLGVVQFVIDNVMTLDVDRQDNTAQAAVADKIRLFVAQYPVHVHVVAHPKKTNDEGSPKPPNVSMIRGASEWGDMPQNIIVVHRDMAKAQRLAEMIDEGLPQEEIERFDLSTPDGKLIVRKQRYNGHLPVCTYFFDQDIKRAYKDEDDLVPYFIPDIPDEEENDS